jgi:hypothetical protein
MPAPVIFKNAEHQQTFEKQGFLVLPLLSEDEVKYFDQLFDELHGELPKSGFYSGSYSSDMGYKKKVSNEIKKVYHRAYEEIFQDYSPFGGAYLFKMPSSDSDLFIHQDWTVVEEEKEVALNIWTPLCDITLDNGPLMVLPGSHYSAFPTLRAPTMRYFFDSDYKIAMQQMVPMLVKAGTAVILNQSLVHYSPPNTSGKIRKAITAGVKTQGAQMIFHYKDTLRTDNLIEKFEMDDDFFIHFENFFEDIYKRPKVGKSIGFVEYEVPLLNGNELESLIRKMKQEAGYDFFEPEKIEVAQEDRVDSVANPKPFWEVYTPGNIVREIKFRLTGK